MKLVHSEGEEHGVILTSKELQLIDAFVGMVEIPTSKEIGYHEELNSMYYCLSNIDGIDLDFIKVSEVIVLETRGT